MQSIYLEVFPQWGLRDPFSMLSHLFGALLGVVALVALLRRARRRGLTNRAVWTLAVYGASLVLTFSASALFHGLILPPQELVLFKKLDHAAIFVMIAGTGTALYAALRMRRVGVMIGALWTLCLGALGLKMIVWPMPLWMTALTYLVVGWGGLGGLLLAIRQIGWQPLRFLFWGTAVLSLGAGVFATGWPVLWPGVIEAHEIFHLLALLGTGIHFWFVYETCTRPAGLIATDRWSIANSPLPVGAVANH